MHVPYSTGCCPIAGYEMKRTVDTAMHPQNDERFQSLTKENEFQLTQLLYGSFFLRTGNAREPRRRTEH
jgi:hypothetical protein